MNVKERLSTHVEYDDFGVYEEVPEEQQAAVQEGRIRRENPMKNTLTKISLIAMIMTILFSITAFAATCGVKGCYKSTVYGGSYCSSHTCSKTGCKNLAVDGGYCSSHQKKTYGSSSSSSAGQSGSKTCVVSGCNKSATGGSSYCYTHKCKHSGCKSYGPDDGYCASHAKKSSSSGNTSSGKKYGSSGSSSSGSSSSTKQCIVTGCHNSRMSGSSYCSKHKCGQSGCNNKADGSGYCSRHHSKAGAPYDVYDFDDPEDFYWYWEDDFDGFEDAEDYWESAW